MRKTTYLFTLMMLLFSIPVFSQIPVTPNSISGPAKVCKEDTVTYSISNVANATYYLWTVPTGCHLINGDSTNIISATYDSTFIGGNLTVSACNTQGCSPQRIRSVSLNYLPAPASIFGDVDGLCNTTRTYTSAGVVGAHYYNWSLIGNGISINGANNLINVSVSISDSFSSGQIMVAAVNKCGIGTAKSLTIKGFPAQPGPITGEINVCMGGNYQYSIATVPGTSNYIWTSPGAGTIVDGQGQKIIHIGYCWYNTGSQNITVKASNSCGVSPTRTLGGVTTTNCQ